MRVAELIERFPVTPATIRRDLTQLEQTGKIVRKRGEAHIAGDQKSILPYFQRGKIHSSEKIAIARVAKEMVLDNQSIILDAGTTTLEIAQQLHQRKDLTIITNSVPIAYEFPNQDAEIRLSGGIVLSTHMSLIGPDAEQYFDRIQVDTCFLGASGVRSGSGFTTSSSFEYSIKRHMMQAAKEVIVVVDPGKFAVSGIIEFARFEEIDKIITCKPIKDEKSLSAIEKIGIEIIYANI